MTLAFPFGRRARGCSFCSILRHPDANPQDFAPGTDKRNQHRCAFAQDGTGQAKALSWLLVFQKCHGRNCVQIANNLSVVDNADSNVPDSTTRM